MLKRIAALILVALLLGAALAYSQWKPRPLKVSGFIEADEIRVGSRVGGRVQSVAAEEGRPVATSQPLVVLEPYDLLERRAQARSELAGRRAELERLQAGFRPEEIAQAKARRDQLAARLKLLEEGPRKQEITAARAQLDLATAQLDLARVKFARVKEMSQRGAASAFEMDQATDEQKVAQAALIVAQQKLAELEEGTRKEQIEEARAQLQEAHEAWQLRVKGFRTEEIAQAAAVAQAAQAALTAIDRQIEELTIRAPGRGVVEAVDLQPGDLVAPNAPVISILDAGRLWVRAYVPENRLDIQVGQKVFVTVDSFPGQRFAGHISFIARQAEFTPGNVQTPEERSKQVFRIKVMLDEGLDRLRVGMAADVAFK